MSADKHPAEVLADDIAGRHAVTTDAIEFWLRRIPALEAELELSITLKRTYQEREAYAVDKASALEAERDQLRAEVEALRAERMAVDAAYEALQLSGEVSHYIGKARRILAAAIRARKDTHV